MYGRPRLLDLFCGAGGAGVGYARSGFDVVGVDLAEQPRYPFPHFRADALEFLRDHGHEFDAIHASPPCQRYSKAVSRAARLNHADLVDPVRRLLEASGKPYVIENVPGAPLRGAFLLCGTAFGLGVRRHRLFESNVFMLVPGCSHGEYARVHPPSFNRTNPMRFIIVSGGFQRGVSLDQRKRAMGVDWPISEKELSESIPPAYTEFIGRALLEYVEQEKSKRPDRGAADRGIGLDVAVDNHTTLMLTGAKPDSVSSVTSVGKS